MPDELRERVSRDVDERLAALRERFGEFPVERTQVANDPARFAAGRELAAEGWRGDAGAFVTDAEGRALFVRHEAAPDTWGTPGGGHEPGESFAETACREAREETGVDPELTGVWRARRKTFYDRENPGRELEMLTVRFEGETDAAAPDIDVGDDEILAARWFGTVPGSVDEHVEPLARERLGNDGRRGAER